MPSKILYEIIEVKHTHTSWPLISLNQLKINKSLHKLNLNKCLWDCLYSDHLILLRTPMTLTGLIKMLIHYFDLYLFTKLYISWGSFSLICNFVIRKLSGGKQTEAPIIETDLHGKVTFIQNNMDSEKYVMNNLELISVK